MLTLILKLWIILKYNIKILKSKSTEESFWKATEWLIVSLHQEIHALVKFSAGVEQGQMANRQVNRVLPQEKAWCVFLAAIKTSDSWTVSINRFLDH